MWSFLIASALMLNVSNYRGVYISENLQAESQIVNDEISAKAEPVEYIEDDELVNINDNDEAVTKIDTEDLEDKSSEKEDDVTSQNTKMTFGEWVKFLLITFVCIVLIVLWMNRKLTKLKQPKDTED